MWWSLSFKCWWCSNLLRISKIQESRYFEQTLDRYLGLQRAKREILNQEDIKNKYETWDLAKYPEPTFEGAEKFKFKPLRSVNCPTTFPEDPTHTSLSNNNSMTSRSCKIHKLHTWKLPNNKFSIISGWSSAISTISTTNSCPPPEIGIIWWVGDSETRWSPRCALITGTQLTSLIR